MRLRVTVEVIVGPLVEVAVKPAEAVRERVRVQVLLAGMMWEVQVVAVSAKV